MKCPIHGRTLEGYCTWCGKHLCESCIGKTDGKILYCEKCADKLLGVEKVKLPEAKEQPKKEEEDKEPRVEIWK